MEVARRRCGQPLIGLDVGRRRVGVAISDKNCHVASPLSWLERSSTSVDKNAAKIFTLVKKFEAAGMVVGCPIQLSGANSTEVVRVRRFLKELQTQQELASLPYVLWDERLTSMAVESSVRGLDLPPMRLKAITDKMSAVYILQGFLDAFARVNRGEQRWLVGGRALRDDGGRDEGDDDDDDDDNDNDDRGDDDDDDDDDDDRRDDDGDDDGDDDDDDDDDDDGGGGLVWILPVAKHAYIGALFLNSKGGCQTWLSHLATSHGVDVLDLKDVIRWEELTRLWKKRFIVADTPTLAINRLFTMSQGNTTIRDWLTEWQKIAAVPNLNLPFEHLRREFSNRSCAALSQTLGDREQYSTFAEIIDKAREIMKTNRLAAHEKSTWQPTYVEKARTGPRQQHFAAVQQDNGDNPAATPASSDGDQLRKEKPKGGKKQDEVEQLRKEKEDPLRHQEQEKLGQEIDDLKRKNETAKKKEEQTRVKTKDIGYDNLKEVEDFQTELEKKNNELAILKHSNRYLEKEFADLKDEVGAMKNAGKRAPATVTEKSPPHLGKVKVYLSSTTMYTSKDMKTLRRAYKDALEGKLTAVREAEFFKESLTRILTPATRSKRSATTSKTSPLGLRKSLSAIPVGNSDSTDENGGDHEGLKRKHAPVKEVDLLQGSDTEGEDKHAEEEEAELCYAMSVEELEEVQGDQGRALGNYGLMQCLAVIFGGVVIIYFRV
ncbi:hypothetical protein CBR_g78868 [Chara braunii]|uniref:YqgF/RNase H-like domain-containing protein n=1 Tax=Chara braunii TaxID=69332 RepID=A0A388KAN4_CHABU|nr:hypothetical protein CBR_g78868 [Chara braunii]|eukprot:GBG67087.1 hypothetical protein CBR_g78868 [Chara braunii]